MMTTNRAIAENAVHFEIIPDDYGPTRIVFATRAEAEDAIEYLEECYPEADWAIVETADPVQG